jgi:hypothetical protein
MAVLQFEHRGATFYVEHPVFINGHQLAGGVSAGPRYNTGGNGTVVPMWATRLLTVDPGVIRDGSNTLRIESTVNPWTANYDNFTIDNVVIFFKTKTGPGDLPTHPAVEDPTATG